VAAGAPTGADGAAGAAWAGLTGLGASDWRCIPTDLLPPKRAASASPIPNPRAIMVIKAAMNMFFICFSFNDARRQSLSAIAGLRDLS
jgi:hypothetical protein